MPKPHITPWNGFYRCDGDGVAGFGITGASAYWQWLAMASPPKVTVLSVTIIEPNPVLLKTSPEDEAMLLALAAWEPTAAH